MTAPATPTRASAASTPATTAERAIERLARAGVRVGVNVVLTRESFPRLDETLARARSLGAVEAQLLRYKPAGRAATLDYVAQRLSPEQARALGPTLRRLSTGLRQDGRFHVRIDCALVAFLSADPALAADRGGARALGRVRMRGRRGARGVHRRRARRAVQLRNGHGPAGPAARRARR